MLRWLRDGELSTYKEPSEKSTPIGFRYLPETTYRESRQAGDIMSSPVITVKAAATIEEAWDKMQGHGIAHLAVMSEGQFSGLLSDRDILSTDERGEAVETVMSRELLLASPDESIHNIAAIMTKHHIHCVPLLDKDYDLVGLLTTTDILGCMTFQAPTNCWGL